MNTYNNNSKPVFKDDSPYFKRLMSLTTENLSIDDVRFLFPFLQDIDKTKNITYRYKESSKNVRNIALGLFGATMILSGGKLLQYPESYGFLAGIFTSSAIISSANKQRIANTMHKYGLTYNNYIEFEKNKKFDSFKNILYTYIDEKIKGNIITKKNDVFAEFEDYDNDNCPTVVIEINEELINQITQELMEEFKDIKIKTEFRKVENNKTQSNNDDEIEK